MRLEVVAVEETRGAEGRHALPALIGCRDDVTANYDFGSGLACRAWRACRAGLGVPGPWRRRGLECLVRLPWRTWHGME